MGIWKAFRTGATPKNRVEALSDGVYAIILTLLILELKVPHLGEAPTNAQILQSLTELFPKFASWLISFLMLIVFWINHHYMLHLVKHVDQGYVWLNALILLTQSFVPFPAALMGEYPHNSLAVGFFGVVMFVNAMVFIGLHYYSAGPLLKQPEKAHVVRRVAVRSLMGPFLFLLGSAAAFWNTTAAFIIYLIIPLLFVIPRETHQFEVV